MFGAKAHICGQVKVSGNAVGDVLNGPSLLSSLGTCSCKTLSFAKELKGPKIVETNLVPRLGNQVVQEYTGHLLFSYFRRTPSHLLKTEPLFHIAETSHPTHRGAIHFGKNL